MHWITLLAQAQDAATPAEGQAPADGAKSNPIADKSKEALDGVMQGDFSGAMNLFMEYGLPVAGAIAILVVSFFVGKIVSGMVERGSTKAKIDITLSRFFGKLVYYAVIVLGVMIALGTCGVEITSFAAILAAAGFAVGMALSGTLSNFANGVMLLIFRPFKVGDVINAAGVTAKVDAIELFTTTLDTFDNRRIFVPNGKIYGDTIENITYHPVRRCDVNVGVAYPASIDRTREVLSKAAESLNDMMVQGEGRGYQVVLLDLGNSSVNWTVRFWCKTTDFWPVKEALTRAVKMHLDEAGINIPFPQMDVHLHKVGG